MDDIVYMLASSFSTNDLTAMVKGMCNSNANDNSTRIVACALCLSWMDAKDVKKVADKLNDCTSI